MIEEPTEVEVEEIPDSAVEQLPDDAPVGDPPAEEKPAEFDIASEDVPDWMKKFDARDKPFSVSKEDLDGLSMEAKQIIHNLRRVMNDRTRSAADERKASEMEKKTAAEERNKLQQERMRLYDAFNHNKIKELLQIGDAPEDQFSEEGEAYKAKKVVSEYLDTVFGAIREVAEGYQTEYDQEQKEMRHTERKGELKGFITEHPDFMDHYEEIQGMVDKYTIFESVTDADGNESKNVVERRMPPERAYEIIKAQELVKQLNQEEQKPISPRDAAIKRARNAASASSVSRTSSGKIDPPAGLTAREKYQWLQNHPEASKQIASIVARR